jgi:hypothetical protein
MPEPDTNKRHTSCHGPTISKWRLAEAEQFSDWTVEVTTKPQEHRSSAPEPRQTYRLHKVYLGVESGYFRSMIRSKDFKESREGKTSLTLEPSAAKAFPEFLDFVYDSHGMFAPESAVALKHLAGYLQVDSLMACISCFIRGTIDVENVDIFYNEAVVYADHETLNQCLKAIARLPRTELLDTGCVDGDDDIKVARRVMSSLSEKQQKTVLEYALGYAEEETLSLRTQIQEDAKKRKKRKKRIAFLPPRHA